MTTAYDAQDWQPGGNSPSVVKGATTTAVTVAATGTTSVRSNGYVVPVQPLTAYRISVPTSSAGRYDGQVIVDVSGAGGYVGTTPGAGSVPYGAGLVTFDITTRANVTQLQVSLNVYNFAAGDTLQLGNLLVQTTEAAPVVLEASARVLWDGAMVLATDRYVLATGEVSRAPAASASRRPKSPGSRDDGARPAPRASW